MLKIKENLELNRQNISKATQISTLVHLLQLNRGLSTELLIDPKSPKTAELQIVKSQIQTFANSEFSVLLEDGIQADDLSLEQSFNNHTQKIASLLERLIYLPSTIEDIECRNLMQRYVYLMTSKESMGKTRAILQKSFMLKELSTGDLARLLEIKGVFMTSMQRFRGSSSLDDSFLNIYDEILQNDSAKESLNILSYVLDHKQDVDFDKLASKWFEKATYTIDAIKVVGDSMLEDMQMLVLQKIKSNKNQIFLAIVFLIFSIIVLFWEAYMLSISILSSADNLKISFDNSQLLLEQYKAVMDQSMIVSKTDTRGVITYVNEQFCKISGYARDELIGKNHNIIRDNSNKKEIYKELWHTVEELKQPWLGELKNRKKDGTSYVVKVFISPILDKNKNILEYIGIQSDITNLVEQKELFEQVAKTDYLTGYGNRYKLTEDLSKYKNLALAFFNIDNFREINDFYGHKFGDSIILEATCLTHCMIQSHDRLLLYRLKGDEIAILARDFDKDEFIDLCRGIIAILKKRHHIDGKEIVLSWSCGVSFEANEELLISADMALKLAKQKREDIVVYSDQNSLKKEYQKNLKCIDSIASALQDSRFKTLYQPIVNNHTLKHEKYEALVRMIDKDGNVISPYHFLDVAKKSKSYFEITKIVITQAFEKFKSRNDEFSINLSVEDILNDEIKEFISDMLVRYDIGDRVVFELVESEYVQNFEAISEFISKIKKYGCKIAIDDFGTGYSNFEYLIKLKADYLKIDGSLIKNITKDKSNYMVVLTIVQFAKSLGLKTVAEFVENEEIFNLVKEMGVEYSQGYYFAQPLEFI